MGWRFVVCDVAGVSIGDVARGRSYSPAVSRTETASFQVGVNDALWGEVAADGEHHLKVYDSGGSLRLFGPVVAEDEQDGPVTFTAADLSWIFGKRFIAKDTTGKGTEYTTHESGDIIFRSLAEINADEPTGIQQGRADTFVKRTMTLLWKPMLSLLSELGAIEASYEWTLRYIDGAHGTAPEVYLDLLTAVGDDRTESVFVEHGWGEHNLKGYRRVSSIDRLATRVFALANGQTAVAEAYDVAAEERLQQRYEDVISIPDISSLALADALATAHVVTRKQPRVTVELPVYSKYAPAYGVDYFKGDRISARVVKNGRVRVNGPCRAWAATIAITDAGEEQPTIILEPTT